MKRCLRLHYNFESLYDSQLCGWSLKKALSHITVFVLILILLPFAPLTAYSAETEEHAVHQFYEEPKDSLDGIYIGSSGAYRYWQPAKAFGDHGMAVYCYGSNSMPIRSVKYLIKDILKTQDPEFIIIEVRNITKIAKNTTTSSIKLVTDYMPRSSNRGDTIEALRKFAKRAGAKVSNKASMYYNPLASVDSQSEKEKYKSDLEYVEKMGRYKGSPITESSFSTSKNKVSGFTTKIGSLNSQYTSIMNSLLDYCEKLDCDVVFVSNPHTVSSTRQAQINKALSMAKKRGFKTFNMNRKSYVEVIGLDYGKDFYDPRHVNLKGAVKYTDYFASWLKKRYDISDHRNDENYASWTKAYEDFMSRYE